ncbi:hypothetical protein PR048_023272 [Dryococelus australis]|uniref:Uncharacterized protein n=1 Tax=Dryococelus australis TaxID=614101 RepID=A0ABQ9GTM6_9NEOP|nr:hypothetical protein PR048_023272 [Dryococelus australis]
MVPCYRAREGCLKSRFGREDILTDVYIRELINLTIQNMSDNYQLSAVFLYASMLFPLVESFLTDDLLCAWQRSAVGHQGENKLMCLTELLRREVEQEERINIAM